MNTSILYILLALVAGAFVPFQTGSNTALTKALGSGFYASLVVFIVAALAMVAAIIVQRQAIPTAMQIHSAPVYSWFVGGILGAAYIFLLIYLAPKLGIANATGFVVAGQLLTAVLFDHFGLMNFPVHHINWQRVAGILLLCAGVFILKKF